MGNTQTGNPDGRGDGANKRGPVVTGAHPPKDEIERDYDDLAHEKAETDEPQGPVNQDPDDLTQKNIEDENDDEVMPRKNNPKGQ